MEGGSQGNHDVPPNAVLGAVLSVATRGVALRQEDLDQTDPTAACACRDREPPLASLRWPAGPSSQRQSELDVFVRHPHGDFAVFIGHVENGDGRRRSRCGSMAASNRAASARSPRRCRWTCVPRIALARHEVARAGARKR